MIYRRKNHFKKFRKKQKVWEKLLLRRMINTSDEIEAELDRKYPHVMEMYEAVRELKKTVTDTLTGDYKNENHR